VWPIDSRILALEERMMQKLVLTAALAALLGTGLLHGRITNRWGNSDTLQGAVDKLPQLPLLAGPWDGTLTEMETDPVATRGTGAHVTARFVHRPSGEVIWVTLVCGRPGPLSLHPPTVCLPAQGHIQKGPEGRATLSKGLGPSIGKAEFATAKFIKKAPVPQLVDFYWSYSFDGRWDVPQDPRINLARQPAVYKFYVVRQASQVADPLEENPCLPFLRDYLPQLQKVLFPS
jgi:hypothetical protein